MSKQVGSKYEATKHLDTAAVAKLIREDIATEQKAGALKGFKCSVRTRRFAGGSAIDVEITAVPAGVELIQREYVVSALARRARPGSYQDVPRHSATVETALEKLRQFVAAYNFDGSDAMTDYFHVRYYSHVSVSSALQEPAYDAVLASIKPEDVERYC